MTPAGSSWHKCHSAETGGRESGGLCRNQRDLFLTSPSPPPYSLWSGTPGLGRLRVLQLSQSQGSTQPAQGSCPNNRALEGSLSGDSQALNRPFHVDQQTRRHGHVPASTRAPRGAETGHEHQQQAALGLFKLVIWTRERRKVARGSEDDPAEFSLATDM